jgi:hypothetical protein
VAAGLVRAAQPGIIFWNAQKAVEARDAFAKAVKADPNNASAQCTTWD